MDRETKSRIDGLRGQDHGYMRIATELGISKASVASYCKRNEVERKDIEVPRCKECGARLVIVNGHSNKRFCSDRCRAEYWKKHRSAIKRKTFREFMCADCGHLCGPKVWYSNDKYKRTIWQSNRKFDKGAKAQCKAPTLNKEDAKAMFVKACNRMIGNKAEVLANLEEVLGEITSEETIEGEIMKAKEAIEKTVHEVETLIYSTLGKASDELRQRELEAEYDVQVKRLKELEKEKEQANDKRNRIATFLSSLRNNGEAIKGFDEELFNVMVSKAVVRRDRSIEFVFNSGYRVEVEAGE